MILKGLKRGYVLFFITLVLGTLFIKGALTIDPDFGYRLRNGGYILGDGVPKVDLYSYTMSSYPYVEHAWLIAVGFFYIYNLFGYLALSFVAALIVLLALVIAVKRIELKADTLKFILKNPLHEGRFWYLFYFQFILAAAAILPFSGVRAQVVSWLMISVLIYVSQKKYLWKKWRLLAPVFFVVWSNLHGSFAAGIVILLIVVFTRSLRLRKLETTDVLIVLASVFATFVNPYGSGAWREVWSSVSDPLLRKQIVEWQSTIFLADLALWVYIAFAVTTVIKYKNKFKLENLVLFIGVFFQAILSKRHVPLFLIVSLPMTIEGVGYFYSEISGIKFAKERLHKLLYVAWLGAILVLVIQVGLSIKSAHFMKKDFYPKEAVSFLKGNLPEGEILSKYGWGGYLIWKLPEKKVFIDGRMPSWRYENAPQGESNYAFRDYLDVLSGNIDYKPVFKKYDIDTVLWSISREPGKVEELSLKITTFLGEENKDFSFVKELENDGWQEIYKDSVAVIYQKPQ